MLARVDDYTSLHPVRVSVLSWNVGAKKPPGDAELSALVGPLQAACDVLIVGLQEAVELSATMWARIRRAFRVEPYSGKPQ